MCAARPHAHASAPAHSPPALLHHSLTLVHACVCPVVTDVRNIREGDGVLFTAAGDRYEGAFKAHKMAGSGAMDYVGGHRYEGEWAASVRSGNGTMTWQSGEEYEGAWRHTEGSHTCRTGHGLRSPVPTDGVASRAPQVFGLMTLLMAPVY